MEKKRYLLFRIEREGALLTSEEAKHAVYEAVFSLLGEGGAARAKPQLKLFSHSRQDAVVKCASSSVDEVIAALAAKTEFAGKPIALRLLRISGMIGKLSPAGATKA